MLEPITHGLARQVKKSGIMPQVEASLAIDECHRVLAGIFGQRILNRVQAKSLRNGVLSIFVLNSVLSGEIRLRESEIIKKINTKLRKPLVNRFRYYV